MRLTVLLWLGALAALVGCSEPPPAKTRIVLITADTLRLDSLVAAPGREPSMPATLRFAARGEMFRSFYAASSTTQPTHASLFTGLHPWQHGVLRNGAFLATSHETVAERLRAVGYFTAGVAASFPMHRRFGFDRGFDAYHDDFDRGRAPQSEGQPPESAGFYSLAESVTDTALEVLRTAPESDQFLWVHYFDPHEPYGDTTSQAIHLGKLLAAARQRSPDTERLVKEARERYDRDVEALDRSLDRLFQRLDADAGRFDTTVIFTSDHGESFGEAGTLGHGNRLTEEQIHVPLFIVSPGRPAGDRLDVAGSVDVAETILAIAGVPSSAGSGRDLTAPGAPPEGRAVGMRRSFDESEMQQLVDGRRIPKGGNRFFVVEDGVLYTGNRRGVLEGDRPNAGVDAGRAAPIRQRFASLAEQLAQVETRELIDEETRAALRALGYVR